MKLDQQKCLTNVKAFLPKDKEIAKIIKFCQLKPHNNNWKRWIDNYGNILVIRSDKTTEIIRNNNYPTETNDILLKAHARDIARSSKWAMISITDKEDTFFVWFLDVDDRLKSTAYVNGIWMENKPPLCTKLTSLRTIIKNTNMNNIIVSNMSGPHPGKIIKSWATMWPPNDDITSNIKNVIKELQ